MTGIMLPRIVMTRERSVDYGLCDYLSWSDRKIATTNPTHRCPYTDLVSIQARIRGTGLLI